MRIKKGILQTMIQNRAVFNRNITKKLVASGLSTEKINVAFDSIGHSTKTKVINYKEIGNRVNICPVIIKGTPEQIAFAWNVGIGNSTGIGFGALK